ncbi:MAG: hypothetical protein ACRCZH_01765 [Cetobacterium sp.]
MKKLVLMLTALTVVSAVASAKEVVAAPVVTPEVVCPEPVQKEGLLVTEYISQGLSENHDPDTEIALYNRSKSAYKGFRATSFGMEAEWEHEGSNFNSLAMVASVGMAYGDDWQMGLTGIKFYGLPQKSDDFALRSSDARAELWVRKNNKFEGGKRLDLGARVRAQSSHDRWALRVNQYVLPLGFTTLSGWGLLEYRAMNAKGGADNLRYEVMPLNFTVGPVKLGYYYYGGTGMGTSDYEHNRHQVRAYLPGYNTGKFSSNVELRYEWERNTKNVTGTDVYGFDNRNKDGVFGGYLNVAYKATPQLNLYSYLGVFANKWDFQEGDSNEGRTTYYTDLGVGFGYTF